jgi:nitrate/nitrite-specific signal transduction histidine kinase
VLGQHVQCVYKDWKKGQWLPTVACAILKQLTRQPMKEDYKRYVDQISQNVIALQHICHLRIKVIG